MDQESTKQLKGIDMGMEEGYVIDGKAVLRDVERILDLMKELCGDRDVYKRQLACCYGICPLSEMG